MIHFIVATHGPLAQALMASANMVFGQLENTSCVCLTEEGGIEQFKRDFDQEIRKVAPHFDGIVVLCDLECGTPYNVACTYAFDREFETNVEVVTGVNFPTLLMTAEYVEEDDALVVAQKLHKEALSTIVIAELIDSTEEDDF
ncbi:PTS sugar transporter subunit IIA [Vibrio sp. TRT 21S02]|uniref:PTS sugar transporter subunit IIA n=1 Tax=Vibrio sp. TRT 21S02 TaxID=3418507 RepID=UPI003CE75F2D